MAGMAGVCAGSRFPPCSSFLCNKEYEKKCLERNQHGKGKINGIFLQGMRLLIFQMDGAVPGVQGVEYDGGSAVRTSIIRYGSRAVCGSGFADGGTGKTGWRAGKAG